MTHEPLLGWATLKHLGYLVAFLVGIPYHGYAILASILGLVRAFWLN